MPNQGAVTPGHRIRSGIIEGLPGTRTGSATDSLGTETADDFRTGIEAQSSCLRSGIGDPLRPDRDIDGIACEKLR